MRERTALLCRKDASRYLKEVHGIARTPNTLAKLACVGGGPEFQKFGRHVYYSPAALDRWVSEKLSSPATSTCQYNTVCASSGSDVQ
jgi:hypothetical protein